MLLVDDVISAGTAIREAVALVKAQGGVVAGVVIALDRQERGPDASAPRESAVMSVEREFGCPVRSIAGLSNLTAYFAGAVSSTAAPGTGEAIAAYRKEYGVC